MTAAEPGSTTGGWPDRVVVTGGAGFIGSNLARRLLAAGIEVVLFDNLSRPYARANAAAIEREHPGRVRLVEADLRDADAVVRAVAGAGAVVHHAGQTAVTRSLADPYGDLLDNVVGTVHVLEAARRSRLEPVVMFASTNKVYGDLAAVPTVEEADHYRFADLPEGITEDQPLDFVSPYACSKGAAEQYVLDYARSFGVRTVVFRQSCVYGPHQLGTQDQGWLAWFLLAARTGRPLTVFGDGKQVRDLLYVDDLVDAFTAAITAIDVTCGRVYNVGGGAANSLSVWWQLRPLLEQAVGRTLAEPEFAPWRLGDQRIFCADTGRARREFGWAPVTTPADGLARMVDWLDTVDLDAR